MPEVLSLVERGWRGARECSLVLQTRGVAVTHLLKGSLDPEVRRMIAPYPLIRLIDAPRWLYRLWVWGLISWWTLTRRGRWVLLDNERTLHAIAPWCRWVGLHPIVVRELDNGYELSVGGRVLPLETAFT